MTQPSTVSSGIEMLEALFREATEGMIVSDTEGVIRMANPAAERLFGYERGELVGLPVDDLVPHSAEADHAAHREAFYKGPEARKMGKGRDLFGLRKDGSQFPVEVSLNSFRTNAGELLVTSYVVDITERKRQEEQIRELNKNLEEKVEERTEELNSTVNRLQEEVQERSLAEKALKESQTFYRTIAVNFPGMITVLDRDHRFVFLDGQEKERLVPATGSTIGTSIHQVLSEEGAATFSKELPPVFQGEEQHFEFKQGDQDYACFAVPLPDLEGNLDQAMAVIENITERKEAEKGMERALQREKELNELKSRFISIASHEFRTPLSTILSSVSLIARYPKAEQQDKREKHIERIRSAVQNLTELLNDVLSLSKVEEGREQFEGSSFDPCALIEEVREEMGTIARSGQELKYEHQGEEKNIHQDKKKLRNVVTNLISNAIKYAPPGKPIEIESRLADGTFTLTVRDHGNGIPEEEHEKLFTRFFRGNNAMNIQGTGLGLNIVQSYVELMGGTVGLESRENEGTAFTVEVPVHQKQRP